MALAANSIISQNRTLNSLSFPFPKLAITHHHHHHYKLNLQLQPTNQFHLRTSSISCVAVQNSNPNPTSTSTTNSWSEFSKNVSGEWDGYGADFTREGNPIELPETVVPEAYREWEVKVFDWQTQCPTLAQPGEKVMFYKSIKLLPTVGCEADAATQYSIDERNIGCVDNKVSAFAYQSSGCYVAVWPIADNDNYKLFEVEHCLINPRDRESRVRIIQVVRVQDKKMVLDKFSVFCEQWYGPFRNGDQLGGCAIRDSSFAATDALKAWEVVGDWHGPSAIASFSSSQDNFLRELLGESVQKSKRDESNLILLPRQLWCSRKESEDGETLYEAGWLFDHGHSITSRCTFSNEAKLMEILIAQETAVSEGV